jgi:hypothetical protein
MDALTRSSIAIANPSVKCVPRSDTAQINP